MRTAVFSLGSKLTHTCALPCTTYTTEAGRGLHVAVRHIAAGELLTTDYTGVGTEGLWCGPVR